LRDTLRALAKLSTIDASAREIDLQLQQIPAQIGESQANLKKLDALLARERSDLASAETLKKSHQEEITKQNTSIGQAKSKAAKARNSREADAVERELDHARRTIKERETELATLATAIESQKKTLAEHEGEFEKLRAIFAADETKANAELAELHGKRNIIVVGRDEIAAKIDKVTLRRYEQVREKRGVAVVELETNGMCTGCRLAVPPQLVIEIGRGEMPEVPQCPHCRRFFYVRSLIEDQPSL
jgi:predicted  nucleic acid-binding Zn-ribbon protein